MSLVVSNGGTSIVVSSCLRSARSRRKWMKKSKKNKKTVHWSDSLVEVIPISCQENENEFTTKKQSLKDKEIIGKFLLADLLYSTAEVSLERTKCIRDSVQGNKSSDSVSCNDVRNLFFCNDATIGDKQLSFEKRDNDLSKRFDHESQSPSYGVKTMIDSHTALKNEQTATDNLEHILASLSMFSGEGKRYLNVMF